LSSQIDVKVIAIIPARGGSKRIPRKNVRSFFGVPILTHTISEIKNTELFSRIIVSTDDQEISEIAKSAGAEVMIRKPELADDFATTVDVVAASILELQGNGILEEEVCCIYPVTPKLNKEYLKKAFLMLHSEKLDYVFTAKRFESSPWRALKINEEGKSEMHYPENLNTRTQDLPELYHDAALFYMGTARAWSQEKSILNGNSKFIEVGKYESLDVDNEEDWDMMINIYQKTLNPERSN
jgi:pseudaminic acid cytidylyltransferase